MSNLVPAYFKYWGKADKDGNYHLLPYHCLDVAAVGRLFLESNRIIRHRLSNLLGLPEDVLINFCAFFLSVHDIGKFTEVFQNNRPDLRKALCGDDSGRKSTLRHDNLGYVVWKDSWDRFLDEGIFGFSADHPLSWALDGSFNRLACCFTGHHGYPARTNDGRRQWSATAYFSTKDMEAVFKFCRDQWRFHVGDISSHLETLADENTVDKASWWIAGVMVVCGWDRTIRFSVI